MKTLNDDIRQVAEQQLAHKIHDALWTGFAYGCWKEAHARAMKEPRAALFVKGDDNGK